MDVEAMRVKLGLPVGVGPSFVEWVARRTGLAVGGSAGAAHCLPSSERGAVTDSEASELATPVMRAALEAVGWRFDVDAAGRTVAEHAPDGRRYVPGESAAIPRLEDVPAEPQAPALEAYLAPWSPPPRALGVESHRFLAASLRAQGWEIEQDGAGFIVAERAPVSAGRAAS